MSYAVLWPFVLATLAYGAYQVALKMARPDVNILLLLAFAYFVSCVSALVLWAGTSGIGMVTPRAPHSGLVCVRVTNGTTASGVTHSSPTPIGVPKGSALPTTSTAVTFLAALSSQTSIGEPRAGQPADHPEQVLRPDDDDPG